MATHAIHLHTSSSLAGRLARRGQAAIRLVLDRYLLLPLGAVAALIWANTAPESYFRFAHTLAFPVNEIGMALFFGLVAQQIFEALLPGGALHRWRQWSLPLIAAAGGAVGAASVYGAVVQWRIEPLLHAGWPAAVAVDIAFTFFIARAIFRRQPLVPFLLLLAVAANVIAFVATAPTFVSDGPRANGAAVLMALAISAAAVLHRQRVQVFWPYVWGCGTLAWLALYLEGFNGALALVPIVPFMPNARRRLGELFDDEQDSAVPTRHFEHVWHHHVQVVLLFFGLVNAGVVLSGYGTGTWALLLASLVGRTAGVFGAVVVAVWLGLRLPAPVRWQELVVAALIASTGFTFTLFVATALLPTGPLLGELKLGALATLVGAVLALTAARVLRVGRFATRTPARRNVAIDIRRPA